jgi:hypothetical protein
LNFTQISRYYSSSKAIPRYFQVSKDAKKSLAEIEHPATFFERRATIFGKFDPSLLFFLAHPATLRPKISSTPCIPTTNGSLSPFPPSLSAMCFLLNQLGDLIDAVIRYDMI